MRIGYIIMDTIEWILNKTFEVFVPSIELLYIAMKGRVILTWLFGMLLYAQSTFLILCLAALIAPSVAFTNMMGVVLAVVFTSHVTLLRIMAVHKR